MKKTFLISLAMVVLAALSSMAPLDSHAAEFQDTGYVSIEVPDMTQAVKFFADVLGCEPLGPRSRSSSTDAVLLVCAHGSVVELATAPTGRRPAYHSTPVQLMSDDPVATARSLRQRGVSAVGKQLTLVSGHTAVDLTTPWGLRLQLVAPLADSRLSGR